MLDVTCPSCGETYHVSQEHLGRSLKCRRCETVFEIAARKAAASFPAAASAAAASAAGAGPAAGASTGTKPVDVTDRDFSQAVLMSATPVLVDFWAPWCGPCRALAPTVEQLASEYAGRVSFAKLNTDENPNTATQFGIQGLPTMVLFKGGREVGRLVGLQPKPNIKRALDQVA
jgi:thioredoxin 1